MLLSATVLCNVPKFRASPQRPSCPGWSTIGTSLRNMEDLGWQALGNWIARWQWHCWEHYGSSPSLGTPLMTWRVMHFSKILQWDGEGRKKWGKENPAQICPFVLRQIHVKKEHIEKWRYENGFLPGVLCWVPLANHHVPLITSVGFRTMVLLDATHLSDK